MSVVVQYFIYEDDKIKKNIKYEQNGNFVIKHNVDIKIITTRK